MKRISLLLAMLIVLLSLAACGAAKSDKSDSFDPEPTEKKDIFRFEDYESDDIFDIEQVALSGDLAEKCVSYKFIYLSDGYQIKGYLSVPAFEIGSQEPVKCLLYNHGANRDYGILEDDTTAMICAECDRIVVASQYRGCGGSQGEDQFGGDDLHDVIKLIDLCEERFAFVDMDDFCVAGASRGGMMTYMAARQDGRIKRIIAICALSDLFESYKTRDDMASVTIATIGCTPEEKPEEYEKRSAIRWADEIKVPVLIIHSKGDRQVAYSQAAAMYEKLKTVTDCTFVSHDDDVHGIHPPEDFDTIREWLNAE